VRERPVPAGVAAGHPATADAGIEILADGGTAADAAVAASLASCVAETVMTGIAGGGHAIWFDAARAEARLLDFFVAVPGIGRERGDVELIELEVPFGTELVHYAVGIASCAVPALPAGLDELWRREGRLPWRRLVEPALRLAREGVVMPRAHAACLAMLAPIMTMREGARMYAPGGRLLEADDRLDQPGLVVTLEALAEEGARSFYEGTVAQALLALMDERGGLVTRDDLAAYEATWTVPVEGEYAGVRVLTRRGLAPLLPTLARLPRLARSSAPERVLALLAALTDNLGAGGGDTTNLTVVDRDGNACVLTSSLGLGSGDFLPGFDVHLNSMLGEADLIVAPLAPGERMESMMAPTVAVSGGRLVLAVGAAGGTRLRSAMVQVLSSALDERIGVQEAIDRPRLHPAPPLVHAEPGIEEHALLALDEAGYDVRRWGERHHYFGGVSAIGMSGAGADPRRSGSALALR
jgi:gamma-glutamyltranspeptidase/glutathione hydrolase